MLDVTDEEPLSEVTCPACHTVNTVAGMIGPFELLEVVGHGGMGVVYKARDVSLDRLVALKLLHRAESADPEQIAKLASEASITASINHPHVVKVFTTGTDGGRFYIAMELVDKGTLDSLIGLQGRIAEAQALDVGIQIAQGLRAALQHGLIHRDVKPGNILFTDAHTAKIVDFGLAMLAEDAAAARGEVWGTPYYVAPEKLDQKPEDFRSDMYSLGATLFHAIAGRPPFEAENASLVALKHLKSQAVSLQAFAPWVSGSTAFVINRTLSKDPEQRYQSYDELIEHLEYARRELDQKAAQPAQQQQTKRVVMESAAAQSAMGWITIALIGLMILLGAGYLVYRVTGGREPAPVTIVGAKRATKYDEAYEKARKLLLDGEAQGAAGAFAKLGAERLPRPLLDWTNFHEGLARLVANQPDEARAVFRKIEERGASSVDAGAKKVVDFLVETAASVVSDAPVPQARAQSLDPKSYEALALLVFGLKSWHLERYPEANALLRRYEEATPTLGPATDWLRGYKPLAAPYLNDLREYDDAVLAVKMAKTDETKRNALRALTSAKENLKLGGKLGAKIEAMRKNIGPVPDAPPPAPPPKKPAPKKAPPAPVTPPTPPASPVPPKTTPPPAATAVPPTTVRARPATPTAPRATPAPLTAPVLPKATPLPQRPPVVPRATPLPPASTLPRATPLPPAAAPR